MQIFISDKGSLKFGSVRKPMKVRRAEEKLNGSIGIWD